MDFSKILKPTKTFDINKILKPATPAFDISKILKPITTTPITPKPIPKTPETKPKLTYEQVAVERGKAMETFYTKQYTDFMIEFTNAVKWYNTKTYNRDLGWDTPALNTAVQDALKVPDYAGQILGMYKLSKTPLLKRLSIERNNFYKSLASSVVQSIITLPEQIKKDPVKVISDVAGIWAIALTAGSSLISVGQYLQPFSGSAGQFGDALVKIGSIPYKPLQGIVNTITNVKTTIHSTEDAVRVFRKYSGIDFNQNDPVAVKNAWRLSVFNTNPDLNPTNPNANAQQAEVNGAWQYLENSSILKRIVLTFAKNQGVLNSNPDIGIQLYNQDFAMTQGNPITPKEAVNIVTDATNILIKQGDSDVIALFGGKPIQSSQILNISPVIANKIVIPVAIPEVKTPIPSELKPEVNKPVNDTWKLSPNEALNKLTSSNMDLYQKALQQAIELGLPANKEGLLRYKNLPWAKEALARLEVKPPEKVQTVSVEIPSIERLTKYIQKYGYKDKDYKIVNYPIVKIKTITGGEKPELVKKYTEMVKSGVNFIPIMTEEGYILDGGHRLQAYRLAGRESIPALVPIGQGTGEVVNFTDFYKLSEKVRPPVAQIPKELEPLKILTQKIPAQPTPKVSTTQLKQQVKKLLKEYPIDKEALSREEYLSYWLRAELDLGDISQDEYNKQLAELKITPIEQLAQPTPQVTPQEILQNKLKNYTTIIDKFEPAFNNIVEELSYVEAGKRVKQGEEWVGIVSTFPEWIPTEYRSKDLINMALNAIDINIENKTITLTAPSSLKAKSLLETILNRVEQEINSPFPITSLIDIPAKTSATVNFSEIIPIPTEKPQVGVPFSSIGKFADGTPVVLGHLDTIRPVELPELVQLVKDLMGKTPTVSKRLRTSLGTFYAIEHGKIKLNANLFTEENFDQVVKTLAHEIGHLIDYLPEETLARGNLLGSLLSLNHFLLNQYGSTEVTNKELREELKTLSLYWRPWDRTTVSSSFISYRDSARELYADAISVLFNSPGTLKEMAPKFYTSFFQYLDAKPEVKKAYFELQAILSGDRSMLNELRRARIITGFREADIKAVELQKLLIESRKNPNYIESLLTLFQDKNRPIVNKIHQLEKKGEPVPLDFEAIVNDRYYIDLIMKGELEKAVVPLMEDLYKNGINWDTFGEVLIYDRIIDGDRSKLANPQGITLEVATELEETVKQQLGDKFAILKKNADEYRKFFFNAVSNAHDIGLISDEQFKVAQDNPAYAPLQVIEYMDNYIGWKMKGQIGTFQDVANPANALLLKWMSLRRAFLKQQIVVDSLQIFDSTEADTQFNGRTTIPLEPKDPNLGLVEYYEKGKLKGKYLDKYVADSINGNSLAINQTMIKIMNPLNKVTSFLRAEYVVYNLGFILQTNPLRDFFRAYKVYKGYNPLSLLKYYVKAIPTSVGKVFGTSNEEIKKVIADVDSLGILSVWANLNEGMQPDDTQLGLILSKIELKYPNDPDIVRKTFLGLKPVKALLNFIKDTGELVEIMPKVAGYFEKNAGINRGERLIIREAVGSPSFKTRGTVTPLSNTIAMFSNAKVQALSADYKYATNPTTRKGWWTKTIIKAILPKILMYLALMGAFGEWEQKRMEAVSEYDKTNYDILPLGVDSKSGKTVYFRLPDDETNRYIGGITWKLLNGLKNDKTFWGDMQDIAGYFGGELPNLNPLIIAAIAASRFASGQTVYDDFRQRTVLTEEERKAGGWYALKPFLSWEFNLLTGNIFGKLTVGEQTPTEKSSAERFLQLPIISNVVGRLFKISDYGTLEKYREMLTPVQEKQARQNIDENAILNKYLGEYQSGEQTTGRAETLYKQMTIEILGHTPQNSDEINKANRLMKKFKIAIIKGKSDPKINSIISATTNEEKLTLLRAFQKGLSPTEFLDLEKTLYQYRIVSADVLNQLGK